MIDHPLQKIVRPLGAVHAQDGVNRLQPVECFFGIEIVGRPCRQGQRSDASHRFSSCSSNVNKNCAPATMLRACPMDQADLT